MKILKILFIVLIPAMGFVGCQKSDMKPGCSNHNEAVSKTSDSDSNTNSQVKGRSTEFATASDEEEYRADEVVGSGDDDRDGGDKKTKKLR